MFFNNKMLWADQFDSLFSFPTILHFLFGSLCLIYIYRNSCKNRQLAKFDFVTLVSIGLIVMYPLYAAIFGSRIYWWVYNIGGVDSVSAWIALEQAMQKLPILIMTFLALKQSGYPRKTTNGSSSRYVGLDLD